MFKNENLDNYGKSSPQSSESGSVLQRPTSSKSLPTVKFV